MLQTDKNIEVYIDDILVKLFIETNHIKDLQEEFTTLKKYHIKKLNRTNCNFGVTSEKFLGHIII